MIEEMTGPGIDHLVDDDGYESLTLTGMVHRFEVMPDAIGNGLLAQITVGVTTTTALLPREHIDALHAFLSRHTTAATNGAPA